MSKISATSPYFEETVFRKLKYIYIRGICAVPLFVGLGGPPASRKIREPALTSQHGGKIWGYGRIYPKNSEIGHSYPFDFITL